MTKLLKIRTILTQWLAPLTILGMAVLMVPGGVFAGTDAVNDRVVTPPDIAVPILVLSNDIPGSGILDPNSVTVITPPVNGQVPLFDKVAGTFTYTPNTGFSGSDSFVYHVCDIPVVTEPATAVTCDDATVDIFVGFEVGFNVIPRKLNVKKNGVLPVVVRGGDGIELADINPDTLTLEGVIPLRYKAGKNKITLKFRAKDIVTAIGPVNDRDVVVLQLTGEDVNGLAIMGEDPVIILNRGKPKK